MFKMVAMMLMLPMIDEAPIGDGENEIRDRRRRIGRRQRCVERPTEVRTTTFHEQGRYHHAEGEGKIQKDRLFMRGNAMSGAPTCIGINQFAKPTNAGMIALKTMMP